MVNNPVARALDDGNTCEIQRLCTDGTKNACSFLYGRCARIAKELGYKKIITYILDTEPGTSLKAAGFTLEYISKPSNKDWSNRKGRDCKNYPRGVKQRWAKYL